MVVGAPRTEPDVLLRSDWLFDPVEEVVIGGIGNQCLLAHIGGGRATRSGSKAALGIQTLNKGGISQKTAAGWSFVIADRLKQEAGDGLAVRAARVGTRRDGASRLCPNLAGVKRTLPGCTTEGHWIGSVLIGICVGAEEV